MNDEYDQARGTFFAESREMLQQMEESLLVLEQDPADIDTLHALFRAAHTIKGSAGLFGYERIVAFTHRVESVLERARSGEIAVDGPLLSVLLPCTDYIGGLLSAAGEEGAEDRLSAKLDRDAASLIERLMPYLSEGAAQAAAAPPLPKAVHTSGAWHLSLRLSQEVLRNGLDPLGFIRYLDTLGEVVFLAVIDDALPSLAQMDPEACYVGFEMRMDTAAGREKILSVFEFMREDCTLRLVPPDAQVRDYVQLIEELPEAKERLGEILVGSGALTRDELNSTLAQQGERRLGEAVMAEHGVSQHVVDAALVKQTESRAHRSEESRFVRVQADKLDRLINLVGELVIAGAGANLLANRAGEPRLVEATDSMSTLVEEIRNSALQLRMVQIGETFARFRRVVRDVSDALGKKIDLEIRGAETELDKTVVEKIADPLMHLVRNAVDHGIEIPEQRAAAGKPATGKLTLSACHDSGSVLIEVRDDGRGLDRDRILRKAVERGLVPPEPNLSDQEIYNLIFMPGFSTAEQVTDLSGRGVGMDVVKRNIDALRGSVQVSTLAGHGTTLTIRLPLTLAIIDGFLVGIGNASYVVPLDMVEECIEVHTDLGAAHDVINLRGTPVPFLRLRETFEIDAPQPERESVVVVRAGANRAGLVVDRLMGEFQTVIKPLGKLFRRVQGIGGSTILGNGEVALILDVSALLERTASARTGRRISRRDPAPERAHSTAKQSPGVPTTAQ